MQAADASLRRVICLLALAVGGALIRETRHHRIDTPLPRELSGHGQSQSEKSETARWAGTIRGVPSAATKSATGSRCQPQ